MEMILVISCCVLLTTGAPTSEDISEQQAEKEIKLSSQPLDCKSEEHKNSVDCQIVSIFYFTHLVVDLDKIHVNSC